MKVDFKASLLFCRKSATILAAVLCNLLIYQPVSGQDFHFGASAAMIASQVDGDDLNGFNKFGGEFGLLGGYSINDANWLVLNLQYASFGSRRTDEDSGVSSEIGLRSINVLPAYSLRFGDSWDGQKKFRLVVGPKFQRIIGVESRDFEREDLRTMFVSGNLGLSYLISNSFIIDLTYTHSFQNIVKNPSEKTDTLIPYYLSFGLSYYLYKKK